MVDAYVVVFVVVEIWVLCVGFVVEVIDDVICNVDVVDWIDMVYADDIAIAIVISYMYVDVVDAVMTYDMVVVIYVTACVVGYCVKCVVHVVVVWVVYDDVVHVVVVVVNRCGVYAGLIVVYCDEQMCYLYECVC